MINMFGTLFSVAVALLLGPSAAAQEPAPEPRLLKHAARPFVSPYGVAWAEVLEEAGVKIELTKVAQGRRRRMFVEGRLDIDCCFTKEWRNRPNEQGVLLFTDPLYTTTERYIFKKGAVVDISDPRRLLSMRVAGVRGYTYVHQDLFGYRLSVQDVDAMLLLIEKDRAQVGIMSERYFLTDMKRNPRDLEMGGINSRAVLRAAVHKRHAHLLPQINKALKRLTDNGRIAAIIDASK